MRLSHLVIWTLLFFTFYANASDAVPISLGEQIQLAVSPGTRFSVGNPQVLAVKSTQLNGGQVVLLVSGKSQGYSDLLLFPPNDKAEKKSFRVVTKLQGATLRDVESSLASVKGLKLLPQGNKWIAQGYLKDLRDYNLLQAFVSNSEGRVTDRSRLDPLTRAAAEKEIRSLFRGAGLAHLKVVGSASQIFLEGNAGSKQEKDSAEAIAREVFFNVHSNLRLTFEIKDILRFRVQILEMARSQHSNSGLSWGQEIPEVIQINQKLVKGQFSLAATLEMLEQKGLVKVLSKPEISLNSEGVAELKVGGEIPISLRSMHFAGVQWKPYGLDLRLETPGVARDLARTNILVDISTLDHANSIEGVPATKINHLQTVVDLSLGKTVFLSGLMQNATGENIKSLPLLGDIPILGELFKSKDFQEQRSELVMAITVVREGDNGSNAAVANL